MQFTPTPSVRRLVTIDYSSLSQTDSSGLEHFNFELIDLLIANFNTQEHLVKAVSINGRSSAPLTMRDKGEVIASYILGADIARTLAPDRLALFAASISLNIALRVNIDVTEEQLFERMLTSLVTLLPRNVLDMSANELYQRTAHGIVAYAIITKLKNNAANTAVFRAEMDSIRQQYSVNTLSTNHLFFQIEEMAKMMVNAGHSFALPSLIFKDRLLAGLPHMEYFFVTGGTGPLSQQELQWNMSTLERFKSTPIGEPFAEMNPPAPSDIMYGARVSAAITNILDTYPSLPIDVQQVLKFIRIHFTDFGLTRQHLLIIAELYTPLIQSLESVLSYRSACDLLYQVPTSQMNSFDGEAASFDQSYIEVHPQSLVQDVTIASTPAHSANIAFGPQLPLHMRAEPIRELIFNLRQSVKGRVNEDGGASLFTPGYAQLRPTQPASQAMIMDASAELGRVTTPSSP